MGSRGFCRIRPVHVSGIVKRYRQLLGEKRYVEIHDPENAERIEALSLILEQLGGAMMIVEPSIEVATLKPIAFRPLLPLPRTALTRAILSSLRLSLHGENLDSIVASICYSHSIRLSDPVENLHFKRRVMRTLSSLCSRDVVSSENGRWSIKRTI